MKAILITPEGGLRNADIGIPDITPEQMRVRVRATAVNRADVLQRRGLHPPPKGTRADLPGLEFAGEIETMGSRVQGFSPGQRVMGIVPGEAYAQYLVTLPQLVLPVPDSLGWLEAAAVPEVFLTAYDALFLQAGLQEGEKILILAVASGVGSAALQLAKLKQAIVFGTSSCDSKLERLIPLGLDYPINYRSENFAKRIQEICADGVQVALNLVGGSQWQDSLRCLAPQGRLILIGLVGGSNARIDLGLLLRRRIQIRGTILRHRSVQEKAELTRSFAHAILPHFQTGRLRPVVDRVYELEETSRAHAAMEENRNVGKIVLRVP